MANHRSALKKIKQDEKRRLRNRAVRTRYRTLVKAVRTAVEAGDADKAREALGEAAPFLHRAVSKGVVHRNMAARHISRLTRQVQGLGS